MGTFIHKFQTQAEFEAAYNNSEVYREPWTSLVEGGSVAYNKSQPGPTPHDYSQDYLTIVMLESGSIETYYDGVFFSSDNGQTWHEGSITGLSTNDKVLIKGDVHEGGSSDSGFLSITGLCNVEGNIMSVYDSENFRTRTTFDDEYDRLSVFGGCTGLTSAENLVLPVTALTENCYGAMFLGCTSLTTPPALPATTLATSCYWRMFQGCTSLTTAPELPATTLANNCYNDMFNGCTSLTTAPELPATTLAEGCYLSMFSECSNLTTAPELPATTLVESCYMSMFSYCNKLNYIKCLATDIDGYYCTTSWLYDVASTGTFVKNPSMTEWLIDDSSGIPENWTVEDAS